MHRQLRILRNVRTLSLKVGNLRDSLLPNLKCDDLIEGITIPQSSY
jgi:hypothetical protein